jgi:hypothetical protein
VLLLVVRMHRRQLRPLLLLCRLRGRRWHLLCLSLLSACPSTWRHKLLQRLLLLLLLQQHRRHLCVHSSEQRNLTASGAAAAATPAARPPSRRQQRLLRLHRHPLLLLSLGLRLSRPCLLQLLQRYRWLDIARLDLTHQVK